MASTTPRNIKKETLSFLSFLWISRYNPVPNFLGILIGHAANWLYGFFEAWKLDSNGWPSA